MGRNVALSIPSTTGIVNRFSAGGVSQTSISSTNTGVAVASGVGTANVLATVLSVTGSGYVPYLICYSNSATPSHTIRCQVLVDGIAVFDATSDNIATTSGRGMCVVNSVPDNAAAANPSGYPIRYNGSVVVKIASSQSGTDYVAIRYELSKT